MHPCSAQFAREIQRAGDEEAGLDIFMHKLGPSVMSAHLANNKQACLGSIEIKFKITKLPTILERTVDSIE